jgi:hypothetical protein
LREEAALECVLLAVHGLLDAPCAFWLPALPAVSGAHNMLVHLGFRRPPERWFSQLAVRRRNAPEYLGLRAAARPFGLRLPHPEETPPAGAERIARWLAEARDRSGRAVLKTFASSAVRVADAARRLGIELRGCTIFAGGEPLTERRRRFLSASGAAVFGRYVATETGWLGGACPLSPSPDALHLYTDLVAAVPSEGRLLFTTISPNAGNVLLNTDIGDAGTLRRRRCECLLGRAGLEVEVADVHGDSKVSAAGMTVPLRAVAAVLERLVEEAGGAPDSFRLEQHEREVGELRLVVVLARSVPLEDDRLAGALLERLPAQGPDAALAARAWRESGTIVVRRADPPPLKSTTR